MSKKYKYQTLIETFDPGCKTCPPGTAVERQIKAYRWVRNPITADCLRPPGVRSRGRLDRTQGKAAKCGLLGLSMHRSLNESVAAYQALSRSLNMMAVIFGDHIAEARLTPAHGQVTSPDHKGHFDLYEYNGADLVQVCTVVHKV